MVFLIGVVIVLLVASFFLLKKNSLIIDQNKEVLQRTTAVKVKMAEVISNLHLLDLGIRGYALVGNKQIENAYDTAVVRWKIIHAQLEGYLQAQKFPMAKINLLRDTVKSYVEWVVLINTKINQGKRKEAIEMIDQDKGYTVWKFHRQVSYQVYAFENNLAAEANTKYHTALRNSYALQLLLFLLIVPTLVYLGYYTIRAFRLGEKLLESEAEKNKMLSSQNELLERLVSERTQEIVAQNEEIVSQNEEIYRHNEKLLAQQTEIEKQSELLKAKNQELEMANETIGHQNKIIENENLQLASDLEIQNKELLQSNYELVQKNNRIEQFAYMVSHNLRAPIARLAGLVNIFQFAHSKAEADEIMQRTRVAANELDQVVRGLSEIMQLQRISAEVFSEIRFEDIFEKVKHLLENEIRERDVQFDTQFNAPHIYSLLPYIHSIFYNLISNGIKYRHPDRKPRISIQTHQTPDTIFLEFADNGVGLDINTSRDNLFGLYKRFHFHVEGRGIGLYLVKSQVEMLGGNIEVTSVVLQGTTFKISFPIAGKQD